MKISQCVSHYRVKLVRSTIHPLVSTPITTVQCRVPASMLAQVNTHAALCRSAESSRAMPLKVFREKVLDDPFFPSSYGKNQKGMVADEDLDDAAQRSAREIAMHALASAAASHMAMEMIGVHKQSANRILEPWAWKDVVITATDWDNFFGLRCAHDAQPEMQQLAWGIASVVLTAKPVQSQLHVPYVTDEEYESGDRYDERHWHDLFLISAARCARVSYAQHGSDGKLDASKDMALAQRLIDDGHASPFEHAAKIGGGRRWGKYSGWIPARYLLSETRMECGVDAALMRDAIVNDVDISDVADKIKKISK